MEQRDCRDLHELVTKAAKYGSLSVARGQVEVTWSLTLNGRRILHWTESGGPAVKKPTRQGFGTSVIERMIRGQSNREVHLEWSAKDLACELVVKM